MGVVVRDLGGFTADTSARRSTNPFNYLGNTSVPGRGFFFACGRGGEQEQDYRHDKACYCYLTGRQIRLARPTEMELIVLLLVGHREITTQCFSWFFCFPSRLLGDVQTAATCEICGGFFFFCRIKKWMRGRRLPAAEMPLPLAASGGRLPSVTRGLSVALGAP